jgi:hypothetical protein
VNGSANRLAHLSDVDAAYSSRAPAHQGIISEATWAWIGCGNKLVNLSSVQRRKDTPEMGRRVARSLV